MKRELIPYNVMTHREWDRAPRMPQAIAVAIAPGLFVGGVATGLAGTLLTGAISIGLSAVTSWALQALAPKPDLGRFGTSSAGLLVNDQNAIAPQDFIYGEVRKGGTVVYDETTGEKNKFLHRVIALAGHEVEEIGDIYLNDEIVTLDAGGVVNSGPFAGKIRINKHLGDQTTADADLLAESNQVNASFVGHDIAYIYARFEYDREVFANGLPLITAKIKGKKVFDPRDDTTAYSNNAALCLRDFLTASYGLQDSDIDEAAFQIASNECDEAVALAGGGTEPKYTMNGVVRSDQNFGEVLQQMTTCCTGTLFWGMGAWDLVAGAYSAPVEDFTLDDLRGPISVDPLSNLRDAFNAVSGTFNDAGQDYITVDYPTVTSETDAGNFSIGSTYTILEVGNTDFTAIGASSNAAGVTFTATGVGAGTGKASLFLGEDGGEFSALDLQLPFTTSAATAQRIAKLTLFRAREQISMSADFSLKAFNVEVGDIITFTNERYGWDQKQFEVVGWNLNIQESAGISVRLDLQETSEAAYDWNAEETAIIANNSSLPSIYTGLEINNLAASGGGRTQGDGTFVNTAILSWDDADNSFVNEYEVQWRPASDSSYSTTVTSDNSIEVSPTVDGVEYIFRVRSITDLGNRGPFTSVSFTGGGDETGPGPVTDLAAIGAFQTITISYVPPADADWASVNIYESSDSNFANAAKIGSSSGEVFYRLNLPNNITRYYWAETVDFTGNVGPTVGPVSSTTQLIEENDFSQSLQDTLEQAGVQAVNTLPASGDFDNQIVLLLSDFKLYRWDEAAGQWSDTLFTSIADNSVTSDSIIANAVVASKIATGAVTADKISVNELSAVAASIGTFQSALSGERVRITDDVIEVYDSSNQIRVKIGNLA